MTALLVIAGFSSWAVAAAFFWCLCAAAGNADERKGVK